MEISELSKEIQEILKNPKKFRKCSPDIPPCAVCGEMIFEVAVRFWKGCNEEISFHANCVFDETYPSEKEEYDSISYIECVDCKELKECLHLSEKTKKIIKRG